MNTEEKVIVRLAESLGQVAATDLVAEIVRATGEAQTVSAVLELLEELSEASAKAAAGAIEALPELRRRGGLDLVVSWLDLGVALAESSGAAAMKYFKESPLILGLIEPASARQQTVKLALELADSDPNVALDFFRGAPELLQVVPAHELAPWSEVGLELARWDYVLGIEYFRQSPAIARVIPLEHVRAWVGLGMKLITQNSLGKPDYLGTLEFFRTSPAILGDIGGTAVRKWVVDLGTVMADRSPQTAIAFLAESPTLLRRMPSDEWRVHVLQYGLLIAERDVEAALAYVRRSPEILALVGDPGEAQAKFEAWYKTGMEVLEYSAEGARAYFALETKKALASVEQAISGVTLRQVARSLKLFAEGLCGTDVSIRSLPDVVDTSGKEPARAAVSSDGRTIALPAILRRYPTHEENLRLYLVMTAHEAGHLEFGTYRLSLRGLADLIAEVDRRYGRGSRDERGTVQSLEEIFRLYPQPGLIRDLWMLLEDARVESRLQEEYPGLRRDLAALVREAVSTRSLLHGMSVREMVVDCLLLLSTVEPGTVRIPDAISEVVEHVWARCQTVFQPDATAEDVVRLADRVYVMLDEFLGQRVQDTDLQGGTERETEIGAGPKASEELSGVYKPITNWAYRGVMNPEMVTDRLGPDEGRESDSDASPLTPDASRLPGEPHFESTEEADVPRATVGSSVARLFAVHEDRPDRSLSARFPERVFLYDEWDGVIRDYRSEWCRLVERSAPEGTTDFADATLAKHGPSIRLLRRYFESIRPAGMRRLHGQVDGEELDLDAVVRRSADQAAGADPSERVYLRREKRERDVAVAFLVDLSGSTTRQIESDGRRVIDVEKEGLVLLCEALEAVGDQYAVYGYSGQGRRRIDFLILKDFEEGGRGRAVRRIGAVTPLDQNRDGAAIRHTVHKLRACNARVKLLVLISDGRPLDDGYTDEYSLEDTKMALREARMHGIEPFCITVDRNADDYLRRMYGDVRYLVIDRAGALPERLPRVYQRLTA